MSKIDIERLKVDESLWPEGSEFAYPGKSVLFFSGDEHPGWEGLIPRPTNQEWDGGLPGVGVVCECLFNDGWHKVAILARHGSEFWVKRPRGTHIVSEGLGNTFRPLKSKQERQRDDLVDLISHHPIYNVAVINLADDILSRYNLEEK